MFSPELSKVYEEAYFSGLGRSFNEQDPAFRDYVNETEAQLVESLKSPRSGDDIQYHENNDISIIIPIEHPNLHQLTPEDIDNLARVRYLGRSLIECAKAGIMGNPALHNAKDGSLKAVDDAYYDLNFSAWLNASKDHKNEDYASNDPDVASPTRVAEWPYGQPLNCLGMSIMAAGLFELNELPYVYGNELNDAAPLVNSFHREFKSEVERQYPGFFANPDVVRIFELTDYFYNETKDYAPILFSGDDLIDTDETVARSFHHFIVGLLPQTVDHPEMWVQFDPYILTFADIVTKDELFTGIEQKLNSIEGSSTVVIHDASPFYSGVFKMVQKQARKLPGEDNDFSRRIADEGLHKSPFFVKEIQLHYLNITLELMKGMYPEAKPEVIADGIIPRFDCLCSAMLAVTASNIFNDESYLAKFKELADTLLDPKVANDQASRDAMLQNNGEYYKELENKIAERIKHDSNARNELMKNASFVPVAFLSMQYRSFIEYLFRAKDLGSANASSELANPDLMIGAMYLNHYATWRKAGRINFAQQLLRFSPSQLLWQSSQQDGGSSNDEVDPIGKIVKGLKSRQLHPLVDIARQAQLAESR